MKGLEDSEGMKNKVDIKRNPWWRGDMDLVLNNKELREKYKGKWVAVYKSKVIAFGDSREEIKVSLRKIKTDFNPIVYFYNTRKINYFAA